MLYQYFVLENNTKSKNSSKQPRTVRNGHTIGKSADEFWNENFEDVAEYFRELGFKNIFLIPEKKTLLNEEGAVKGISIAGNTEFEEEDEFSLNFQLNEVSQKNDIEEMFGDTVEYEN